MSIDQLKADLLAITSRLEHAQDIAGWIRDDLLPYLESQANEMAAMDEAIGDIFHQSEDVLHSESAAIFAAVITSGLVLAAELKTRIGNDRRLLRVIEEFGGLAKQAQELLGEITLVDEEEDDVDEEDDEDKPATEGSADSPKEATSEGSSS